MRKILFDIIFNFNANNVQHKIAKNTLYVISLRALELFLGFAATYFIVRSLSKESFGEYHFILSSISVLAIFSLKGLNNSVMQAIARGYNGTYRKAVKIAFIASLIGSFILLVMAFWQYNIGKTEIAYGFIIAAMLFPFVHGLMQWKSIHMGKEKFGSYFLFNSMGMIIMYPLIILMVILFPGTLLMPLALILIVPSIINLWLTIINFRKLRYDSAIENGNIAYGIKTTFYTSFYIISMHADRLLLFFFLSPTVLATYVVADRIADVFRNITQDISVVLAPKFANYNTYTRKLDRYLKLFSVIYGIIIIVFAFTFLPFLMIFIFGESYAESIPYAQALLCSVTIGNMATIKFRFIRSKIDDISFRDITVFTSLGRIIVSLMLIPWLGILGAVISAFLYRVIQSTVINVVVKRNYPIDGELNHS